MSHASGYSATCCYLSHAIQSHATRYLLLNWWKHTWFMRQCGMPHVAKILPWWNRTLKNSCSAADIKKNGRRLEFLSGPHLFSKRKRKHLRQILLLHHHLNDSYRYFLHYKVAFSLTLYTYPKLTKLTYMIIFLSSFSDL